jgi:hypothetical protein
VRTSRTGRGPAPRGWGLAFASVFKEAIWLVESTSVKRLLAALAVPGILFGSAALGACGSSTTEARVQCSPAETTRKGPLPKVLSDLGVRLKEMGWAQQPGRYTTCSADMFSVRQGPVVVTQFLRNGEIVGTSYVSAESEEDRQHARDDFVASAEARGFEQPVVDGDRFYMKIPVTRVGRAAQQDLVGWIVPRKGVVVVWRSARSPVSSDAPTWLRALTEQSEG